MGTIALVFYFAFVNEKHGVFDVGSVVEDIFDNSYLNGMEFESYGEDMLGKSFSANITYMIYKKYNRLSGTIAYEDVTGQDRRGLAHFEIYSDGVLVYTSPKIDDDTQPIDFEANLGNSCQKMTIKLVSDNVFDAMCVLGNAQLYNRD